MPFATGLEYEVLERGELWRLTKPLVYEWQESDFMGEFIQDHRISVPAGYHTDFLSLPGIGRLIYSNDGPGKWASVVHDYGFTHLHDIYTREQVDHIFNLALRDDPETPTWLTRQVFYCSVRWGGQRWWDRRIEKRMALQRRLGVL